MVFLTARKSLEALRAPLSRPHFREKMAITALISRAESRPPDGKSRDVNKAA